MFHVFLCERGMSGASLEVFQSGMHEAFWYSFAVTLVAAVVSALRAGARALQGRPAWWRFRFGLLEGLSVNNQGKSFKPSHQKISGEVE
jgi:hypothetical protein